MLHPSKKYYTQSADQDDLISIGTIGLIKGISSFDPAKGARLATYAARCIENEILMYFRGQKKLQGEVSLSDSIDTDKDGNALQLMYIVGVDDTMLEDLHDRDNALRLHKLVRERLTSREAEIIRLRYGLGGTVPLTQREIAASFGISRSYVSRIEKRALEKLREALQEGQRSVERAAGNGLAPQGGLPGNPDGLFAASAPSRQKGRSGADSGPFIKRLRPAPGLPVFSPQRTPGISRAASPHAWRIAG